MAKSVASNPVENLVQITQANRKFCVKMGRKIHRYKKTAKGYDYHFWFEIRPLLKVGWYVADGHRTFISEDEDREFYIDSYKHTIDLGIKEGILYINPEEPLIKFDCSWDKKK